MSEQLKFSVPIEYDKSNALRFLKEYCGLSSRMITRLKRENNGILMDNKILRTIDNVIAGKTVYINIPAENSEIIPIEGTLNILYEDQHLIIVNKPPFMPVHPVKQHQVDTLANIVSYYMFSRGENYIFRAHNRLDKDTSGIVVIAKNRYCANALKNSVNKCYYAICHGKINAGGTIKAPIGLKEESKMIRFVLEDGPPAITHYELIKSNDTISFIKLRLETGKTHQIRCHMASIGHPLLGDDLYGGSLELINRQTLHCGEVEFKHPVFGNIISLKSEIPNDMKHILNIL